MWKKVILGKIRIREIEQGVIHETLEVIEDSSQIKYIYLNLIEKSREEILMIFPSVNAVYRQGRLGIINLLKRKAIGGVKVKILTPITNGIKNFFKLNREIKAKLDSNKKKIKDTII